ncbi:MAG: DUF362 domain-containing protein [Proteobacteria bacterium]|nr:DUF362 domain-containing protein [Pseudomonadota bacterium]
MTKVALLHCAGYENDLLKNRIRAALSLIGFDLSLFSGLRVGLKPNLLMPFSPDRAVITHPEFFRAAAQVVLEAGGMPVLMECPNFFSLDSTIRRVGYDEIVNSLGIPVANMEPVRPLHYDQALLYKSIEVAAALFDVDILVNLPKFKTHAFTYVSGSVKHLFGVIPGLRKSRMHMRLPSVTEFSDFLLDLYGAVNQRFSEPRRLLHIMDAVLAMEGEGPGPSGSARRMDAVLASEDGLALDWTAVSVAGLSPDKVLTLTRGFTRPFGVSSPDEIEVVGDRIEDLKMKDFAPPSREIYGGVGWPITSKTFKNWFVERPEPDLDKCVLCYQCQRTCPAGAISRASEGGRAPRFDYKKCIRCFCCMEICPEAALSAKKGRLQWMLRLKG